MNEKPDQPGFIPPVSTFGGPVAELIAQRMLQPPSRPGLLAVLGRFEILRVLGRGGMGIVLLARDTTSGKDVAIKLINYELANDQNVVHRFLKEAGHLKRLQHPNIMPVLEVSDTAVPYFVMPYFEKGSLSNRIRPEQPLDTEAILDIGSQVAHGLSFAHRSGIIHRDLKPVNILLDANGQVCIADFGLARTVFNDTLVDVENGQLEGTAPYMSPAVAAGDAEDTRCDIYSFGALLYEMLTGRPPYKGRTTKEVITRILAGPPRPIASLNPNADARLIAVAEKAMARELRDRYADMRDALQDLQLIREGGSPTAQRKVGAVARLFEVIWVPVVIVVIGLLVWTYWENRPAQRLTPPPTTNPPVANPVTPAAPVSPKPSPPQAAPIMTVVAGQAGVSGSADGSLSEARFQSPNSVAMDGAGNVYVADTANNIIRKIASTGIVTTLAGASGSPGNADGTGNSARFLAPFGIAADVSGNVYVADTLNNTIRKISPAGVVTTIAGQAGAAGSADGSGSTARFRNPWGVALDASGNLYVADMSNDTIRKITPSGSATTLAGHAGSSGSDDGSGDAARFNNPFALAVDRAGNVYVSDSANNIIRRVAPSGLVSTLAGLSGYAGSNDGNRSHARFSNPQGLVVDGAGNVFVADTGNGLIRKLTPAGDVTTLLIPSDDSSVTTNATARLNSPCGIALDAAGNLYVADTGNHCIRKIVLSSENSR